MSPPQPSLPVFTAENNNSYIIILRSTCLSLAGLLSVLTTTTLAVDSLPFFTANEQSLNDTYLRPNRFQLSSLGNTRADGHETPLRFSSAPYMNMFILRLRRWFLEMERRDLSARGGL